jgi:hypothetical protein
MRPARPPSSLGVDNKRDLLQNKCPKESARANSPKAEPNQKTIAVGSLLTGNFGYLKISPAKAGSAARDDLDN